MADSVVSTTLRDIGNLPSSEADDVSPAKLARRSNSPSKCVRPGSSPMRRGLSQLTPGAVLRFVRLSERAFAPERGSALAAGYDLRSAYDAEVPAHGKALIKTDLQIELPEGCYGRVAPRSGLAWRHHIDVGAGVIDRDYRGNVGVVLFNHGPTPLSVCRGDRVAQLVLERVLEAQLQEVQQLSETERGEGGFGSTGRS